MKGLKTEIKTTDNYTVPALEAKACDNLPGFQ